jgi:hypothetical protein
MSKVVKFRAFYLLLAGLVVVCVLTASPGQAQGQLVVATLNGPTSTSALGNSPFGIGNGVRWQNIYAPQEIGMAGRIVEIRVTNMYDREPEYQGLRLAMAHSIVAPLNLNARWDDNYHGMLQTCLGPVDYAPQIHTDPLSGLRYSRFILTTPFIYNGHDNLLFDWYYTSIVGTGIATRKGTLAEARQGLVRTGAGRDDPSGLIDSSGDFLMQLVFETGSTLYVVPVSGTPAEVGNAAAGPGNNGLQAGAFEVRNVTNDPGGVLESLEIEYSGTANGQTAFSEIALYEGDGGTDFDPINDTLLGTYSALPASNRLTFQLPAALQEYAPLEIRRYFVVVKLGGTAAYHETLNFFVSDLQVSGPFVNSTGAPSDSMAGLSIIVPMLEVSESGNTRTPVWNYETGPGNQGVEVARFTVEETRDLADGELEFIRISGTGDLNPQTAFAEIALYEGQGASYDPVTDTLVAAHTSIPASAELTFTLPSAQREFGPGELRTYFLVVKMSGTADYTRVFDFQVDELGVDGVETDSTGWPTALFEGLTIRRPNFTVADESPATPAIAYQATQGNLVQTFTIDYPDGPVNALASISFRATGTGNEATGLDAVHLWFDSNEDGVLDAGDTHIGTASYTAMNGTVMFSLASMPPFQPGEKRRFFVTYDTNSSANVGHRFGIYVSAFGALSEGGSVTGLPAPSSQGNAGILIERALLEVSFAGPVTPEVVNANTSGPSDDGVLLYDMTVEAVGTDWTLNGLVFRGTGTGDPQGAYAELALYEMTGSGAWSGAAGATLASQDRPAGFGANDESTFLLADTAAQAGVSRRFVLVARLNGTALAGETLNAELADVGYFAPPGSRVEGMPLPESTALVIDSAVLTVRNSAIQPEEVLHNAGASQAYMIGRFSFDVINANVEVTELVLTGAGDGDWNTWLNVADGVQVWADDGDGEFDPAADTLLYAGPGATVVTATFTTAFLVPNNETRELFVRLNLTAHAGEGAAAAPATFGYSVATPGNVAASAGVQVLFGTPPPVTRVQEMIEFFVSGITPLRDSAEGGAMLVVTGSGFMQPFEMRIGDTLVEGTPVITDGTQVTGLVVPAGENGRYDIRIRSGDLPEYTHNRQFRYGTSGDSSESSGCTTKTQPGPSLLILGALLLTALTARRLHQEPQPWSAPQRLGQIL